MKTVYAIICISAICFISQSCKKEAKSAEFVDSPVVEAYLHSGDYLKIKISRQISYAAETEYSSDNLDSLDVNVLIDGVSHKITSVGSGVYIDSTLIVTEGKSYSLEFMFNNKKVSATTTIPSKPANYALSATSITMPDFGSGSTPGSMPDPVELTWDNDDKSYYMVVIENIEADPVAINDDNGNGPPPHVFRNQPLQNNTMDLSPMSFSYYGTHRVILFHMNPDYATLYDQNGNSSINIATPASSIDNGLGIFTGINSDTLWIEVKSK